VSYSYNYPNTLFGHSDYTIYLDGVLLRIEKRYVAVSQGSLVKARKIPPRTIPKVMTRDILKKPLEIDSINWDGGF